MVVVTCQRLRAACVENKNPSGITIPLLNGKTKTFNDSPGSQDGEGGYTYGFHGCTGNDRFVLISMVMGEGERYEAISRLDGKVIELGGAPNFSPSKESFI